MIIPKEQLKDGAMYIGRTNQRGMPLGKWDSRKNTFVCIKPAQFGEYSIYYMQHIEDEKEFVAFEPMAELVFDIKRRGVINDVKIVWQKEDQ